MNYCSGLPYLLTFAIISILCIGRGLFDAAYTGRKAYSEPCTNEWCSLHMLLTVVSVATLIWGWKKTVTRKITVLDFYFLVVFCGLSFAENLGLYMIAATSPGVNDMPEENVKFGRLRAFTDWAALPLLGWIIAWSRHIRRGWYPKRNYFVFGISIGVFFLTIIHPTAYAFQLSVIGVLSCIAVYEFYKVHFFRSGVKLMFATVLISNVAFCSTRLIEPFVSIGWTLFYGNVLSSCLLTTSLSHMFIIVLENVNEHKH